MVTIKEIIQYYISKQSSALHQLKNEGLERQTIERFAYISPDGKHFRNNLPACNADAWRYGKVTFVKLSGFISPKHARWRDYQIAKRQASLLLTARRILKLSQESVPEIKSVRDDLKAGRLSDHANNKRAGALALRAYRYLRKIKNRLERGPQRFVDVESWLAQQTDNR